MSRTYRKENGNIRFYTDENAEMRFMERMRDFILNYHGSQEQLIKKINKKIDGWVTYHKVDVLPDSGTEVSIILTNVLNGRRIDRLKYLPLDDFFRIATKAQFTLTMDKIDEIVGEELEDARNEKYWMDEESEISESWIGNGYSVKHVNVKKGTVTFKREFIKTGAVKINEVFLAGKVPLEAKYEFENYQKYLCEKYGL